MTIAPFDVLKGILRFLNGQIEPWPLLWDMNPKFIHNTLWLY